MNGYPVIRTEVVSDGPDEGWVVVMVRRNPHSEAHPYVVSRWLPRMGQQWYQGTYCRTRSDADKAFEFCAERYGRL